MCSAGSAAQLSGHRKGRVEAPGSGAAATTAGAVRRRACMCARPSVRTGAAGARSSSIIPLLLLRCWSCYLQSHQQHHGHTHQGSREGAHDVSSGPRTAPSKPPCFGWTQEHLGPTTASSIDCRALSICQQCWSSSLPSPRPTAPCVQGEVQQGTSPPGQADGTPPARGNRETKRQGVT